MDTRGAKSLVEADLVAVPARRHERARLLVLGRELADDADGRIGDVTVELQVVARADAHLSGADGGDVGVDDDCVVGDPVRRRAASR